MLKGQQVSLRLIQSSDLTFIYEKWHDTNIRGPYYPLAFVPEPLFLKEFNKNGFWTEASKRLLIVDTHDQLVGLMHIAKGSLYSDSVDLSYILLTPEKSNRGLTTEAVQLIVNYLFNHERLNRIQIVVPDGNLASMRVAEKSGFTHEGIAREAFHLNGRDIDLHTYSLLRREWQLKIAM